MLVFKLNNPVAMLSYLAGLLLGSAFVFRRERNILQPFFEEFGMFSVDDVDRQKCEQKKYDQLVHVILVGNLEIYAGEIKMNKL